MNVRRYYLRGLRIRQLLATEVESGRDLDLPLRRRLWLWRRGFLSRADRYYDLDGGRHKWYLNDVERFTRTPFINGEWNVALQNKLVFHWMLQPFDRRRMGVYGLVHDGRFVPVDAIRSPAEPAAARRPPPFDGDDAVPGDATDGGRDAVGIGGASGAEEAMRVDGTAGERVAEALESDGELVLKWIKGGGGNNVYICRLDGETYRVNGEPHRRQAFVSLVDDLQQYLVCEYVEQNALGSQLYPRTVNTLRVLTMYDAEADEPFVPIAIYRIGTDRSYPMDNVTKGGLTAEVDIETGELGPGVQVVGGDPVSHSRHPTTDVPIEDTPVPGWGRIRDRLLAIAAANQQLPYVGWDLVPTDDAGDFTLLEGNSYPGMRSLQVHRPLLADERTRAFYRRHDVIDR